MHCLHPTSLAPLGLPRMPGRSWSLGEQVDGSSYSLLFLTG